METEEEQAIIENRNEGAYASVGYAPAASNAQVKVNPNKLFGRHLAVLGNTGSGKSCSVAGLIRWSLESARNFTENNVMLDSLFLTPTVNMQGRLMICGSWSTTRIF